MSWLLTPQELTPLFVSGNFLGGGEVEAGFRLLQVSKLRGYLSIVHVFWLQRTPKSAIDWLTWSGIYAAVALSVALMGNHGRFSILPFLAGFVPLVFPLAQCIDQAHSKYDWAIDYCNKVVNSGNTTDRIDEATMRVIVQAHGVKNLKEFKEAQQKVLTAPKAIIGHANNFSPKTGSGIMSDPANQAVIARSTRFALHQGLLTSFVEVYGKATELTFDNVTFPDVTQRSTPECDCVAQDTGGSLRLAIEHTELEVLKGKNENDKKFMEHFQGRESEFSFSDFDLQVTIAGSELSKGKKLEWRKVSDAVIDYLKQNAASLPFGYSEVSPQTNTPLTLQVCKTKSSGRGRLDFRRYDSREFRDMSLNIAIQKALSENKNKLAKYSPSEHKRILLMENKDVQITNNGLLYEIYLRATNGIAPEGYDEVWLCWTLPERSGPVYKFICFEGDKQIAAQANELFDVGPNWKEYWWGLIQTNNKDLPTLRQPIFSRTAEKLAELNETFDS